MVEVVTEPKFTLDGEGASSPCPDPVPLTAIDAEDVYLLPLFALADAVMEIEPENVPAAAGANTTEKPTDWPGASEEFVANPDTVKPSGTLIWVMLIAPLLLFVRVAACELAFPATTVPKLRDEGLTNICAADVGEENLVAAKDSVRLEAVIITRATAQR